MRFTDGISEMGARRDRGSDASSAVNEGERARRGAQFEETLNRRPAHLRERKQAGVSLNRRQASFDNIFSRRPVDLEKNRSRSPAEFWGARQTLGERRENGMTRR